MKELVTCQQLEKLGFDGMVIGTYFTILNSCLNKYKINTPLRLAHFFTQVINESNRMKNHDSLDVSAKIYENNNSLGNSTEGDGVKYKPRGFFKLIGKNSYLAYSKYSNHPILVNPSLINSSPEFLMDSCCWYWSHYLRDEDGLTMNELSDYDWFFKLTFYIENKKFKSLKNKIYTLKRCYEIFDVPKRTQRLTELYNQCRSITSSKKTNILLHPYEINIKQYIFNETLLKSIFKDII